MNRATTRLVWGILAGVLIGAGWPARAVESPAVERQAAAERWQAMSEQERARALENYERWKNIAPEERQRIAERWERFKELPEGQREQIRARWEKYQKMSAEEREELKREIREWQSERDLLEGEREQERANRGTEMGSGPGSKTDSQETGRGAKD